MAYTITNKCENCNECEVFCPLKCVSKGEKQREIDESRCVECGTCKRTCPFGAPVKK